MKIARRVLLLLLPIMTGFNVKLTDAGDSSCGMDVCIVLDMSGSICTPPGSSFSHNCYLCHQDCNEAGYGLDTCCSAFDNQLNFAKDLAEYVSASFPTSRYAMVTADHDAIAHTSTFIGKDAFETKLDTIDFVGGWSNIGDGIQVCMNMLDESDSHNEKLMIILTDGLPSAGFPGLDGSRDPLHMRWAQYKANVAVSRDITVIPVMVNTISSKPSALEEMASDPNLVGSATNFNAIKNDISNIVDLAEYPCGIGAPEENYEPDDCEYKPIDICVAIDQSGSVCSPQGRPGKSCMFCGNYCHDHVFHKNVCCLNFHLAMEFAIDVAQDVTEAIPSAKFSLVAFGGKTYTHTAGLVGKEKFIEQVGNLDYLGGWSDTGGAFDHCWETLKDSPNEKLVVLITDILPTKGAPGYPGGYKKVHKEYASARANFLIENGVEILPILVDTRKQDQEYLSSLGSNKYEVPIIEHFHDMTHESHKITAQIKCS